MNHQTIIKGVIFDLDGTLVSSSLNFVQLKREVNCPPSVDLLTHIDRLNTQDKQQANAIVTAHERADAESSNWMPGAEKLVNQLIERNIPLAIITRNYSIAAQLKIKRNNIPISRVLTREDAPPKPNPAALTMIAAEWSLHSSAVVYIGDYLYDIEAANRAKMHSCLYAPDTLPDYSHQADWVCHHFDELMSLIGL